MAKEIGAEAIVFKKGNSIVKQRIKKSYRHPETDEALRKFRTRREAKVLGRLEEINFPAPRLHDVDEDSKTIRMQHIEGEQVKKVLDKNHKALSREIGRKVAELHKNNIIHGDLTTSNMILDKKTKNIHFIDFGLSEFSEKAEQKAVDLHLLKKAMESKHHEIFVECVDEILKEYKKNYPNYAEVLERLKKVETRGRNRAKHGS